MNKSELVRKVYDDLGENKKVATNSVNLVLDAIVKTVASGEDVNIPGFGKFYRVTRAARTVRNPKTGSTVDVPARNGVRFRAGKSFKSAVS